MPSRPANVSLIHRRCSGRSAAQGREDNPSTEPHPLTFCSMSELRQDLALVEAEEPVLVGADLVDVDLVEAGVLELADQLQMVLGVRAAGDQLCDIVLVDHLRGLLEVLWRRELLVEIAG